jgi:hypothetical protein
VTEWRRNSSSQTKKSSGLSMTWITTKMETSTTGSWSASHKEIAPKAQPHNLHHASRDEQRHEFLRELIGTREDQISRDAFAKIVKTWEIPSLEQDRKEAKDEDDYLKQVSIYRRARAYWAVKGPDIVFMALVLCLLVGFGIWQFVKYLTFDQYTPAFGWGAVLAKTCAGVHQLGSLSVVPHHNVLRCTCVCDAARYWPSQRIFRLWQYG